MNAHETHGVLTELAGAYPWAQMGGETVAVWADHLADIDADVARKAVWAWLETNERPPSIAAFKDQCRTELRERRHEMADRNSRPDTPRSQHAAAFIAAMRAARAAAAAGGDPVQAFEEARPHNLVEQDPEPNCVWCDDTGFYEVDKAGHGTYRPCHFCQPDQHDRWRRGAYESVRRIV